MTVTVPAIVPVLLIAFSWGVTTWVIINVWVDPWLRGLIERRYHREITAIYPPEELEEQCLATFGPHLCREERGHDLSRWSHRCADPRCEDQYVLWNDDTICI